MVFDHLERYGSRMAVYTADGNYSYAQLLDLAEKISTPVRTGELVLLLSENTLETVAAYVGMIRKKAPVIMLNAHTPPANISEIIDRFVPMHIIAPMGTVSAGNYEKTKVLNVEVLSLCNKAAYSIDEDLALLLTTSGSTGSPKFVRLSYKNVFSNTASICNYLSIRADDIAITCLPLYYSFGLSLLNTHLYVGGAIVVTDESFLSPVFWKMLEEFRVSTFSGVPYSFSILRKIGLAKFNLSDVRYVTQAGGKLAVEEVDYWNKFFRKRNIDFVVMYGQTEATARMSYLPVPDMSDHMGSIGIAIPGGNFQLMNDGKVIDKPNEEGELIYEGDNVSMGYAESLKDLSLGDCNGGILHTEDLAYRDKDGFYYIVGRLKRFVKLFGNRTNLDELEHLLKINGVNALCAGTDDNLMIYLTDSMSSAKVESVINKYTLISPLAYNIKVIHHFPISESGKILYSKLSEL